MPAGWTPDQIRQFQDYWDTEFAGDLAKRRRAKFVPGESAVRVHQTKEPEHKQDFDEWLARIICYAFSVPPQWAVKLMNRATADNQSAQAEDEGLEPTKEWVKDLVDEVIAEEFASPDLELMWLDEDSGAAQIEAQFEARVKIGAATLNELRDALGLDPFANPAADRPMVLTPTGYVPIEAGADGGVGADPSAAVRTAKEPSNTGASSAYQKAAVDDPEHPGWPAGTPDSKGGQFRPKDGTAGDSSVASADGAETNSGAQPAASTVDSHVAQIPPLLFENPLLFARPPFAEFPKNPKLPPGPGYEWHGRAGSQPGDPYGAWYNPKTRESLHPDMDHDPSIDPHWDYIGPDGLKYRWFPDGRFELSS